MSYLSNTTRVGGSSGLECFFALRKKQNQERLHGDRNEGEGRGEDSIEY